MRRDNELYFLGTDAAGAGARRAPLDAHRAGVDPEILSVVDVQTLNRRASRIGRCSGASRSIATWPMPIFRTRSHRARSTATSLTPPKESASARFHSATATAALVFQTFPVPKAPVTYLISTGDTPPEVPELQIYVNGRLWTRVPSFFDRGPDEEIYIVREDAENHSWVQFGDGVTGARLPSGVKNVVAHLPHGHRRLRSAEAEGEGASRRRSSRDSTRSSCQASSPVAVEPEDGDSAREAAPGKIQSLDRLVSLEDFESETLAISGVTKASAAWQLVDNIPEVVAHGADGHRPRRRDQRRARDAGRLQPQPRTRPLPDRPSCRGSSSTWW